MNQPTAKLTRKMEAVGISGVVTIFIAWLAREYGKIEIPADVMAGIVTVVVWVVGYLVPERNTSQEVEISSKDIQKGC